MRSEAKMSHPAPSQARQEGNYQFRVIVVGAGVAGLSASHCLQKAGIDHVVIEKHREVAPSWGASITFYPQGARILSQLGCLKSVMSASSPCKWFWSRKPDGTAISRNGFFGFVKEK
jgi:2-polyprenyl-6-methoxyphenol hydroxylase-like FAD-dependent oxidoreductase